MAHILAIEAASDSFSVALHTSGDLICKTEAAPRMHSRLLYPVLNDVMSQAGLKPNQLDAIAFGKGPGSFTGLRIAASTAQGIGYACDIPLMGISTLQAMAQQAWIQDQQENVLAIMDARMNELYVGQYTLNSSNQIMEAQLADFICPIGFSAQEKHLKTGEFHACGHGLNLFEQYHPNFKAMITSQNSDQVLDASSMLPQAIHLFEQQQVIQPDEVELVYLREQSHWKTIKQQKQQK
ncbi:tRNA (adenosine(37)-N6)-threonylcarbamoyltransferase complex dimerization subunit type 1 TsaB [Oceaniserpentilla sp. 4NH20-0058]|uniref:tRNA (adenosine(37)-N6)-threonylcarbamoyltransferase complex dimerization subunit type 1 TsaB n=1 Tax=Oceaniserpentilla sp. 4NH20-0058 TaxID=3127660 RepID=UPI003109E1DA